VKNAENRKYFVNECCQEKLLARQRGFSLLEVVITIGILMTLTIAVATMLRSGFDVKSGLADRARMLHRLSLVMTKIANDVQHTFYVSTKDGPRNGIGRSVKTTLKIEKVSDADKISLTTTTHRPMLAGAHEADVTFVVYELKSSKDATGRKNLYRGESKTPPEDLKEEPPMKLLARNIKSLTISYWNGNSWSSDMWDSSRSDYRNRLPKMVKIMVEAWKDDRVDSDGGPVDEAADAAVDKLETVVYLAAAGEYEELKPQDSSIKWGAM
jgi:type II secretory pathway pseudopilin PulG